MVNAGETKRQDFNITSEKEAQLDWLKEALGAPSTKEADKFLPNQPNRGDLQKNSV
jgi:hypothetical protein